MEEDENGKIYLGHSPKKRERCEHQEPSSKQDVPSLCIICMKKGNELVNPTEKGTLTLYNTMGAVKDGLYSQHKASGILDETNFVRPIRYHRNCYQNYTSKHNLSYRQETNSCEDGYSDTHDYLTRSGVNPMDISKCLFCGYLKKRGDRDLVQVSTFPIQEKIENAAQALGDRSLLSKVLGKKSAKESK